MARGRVRPGNARGAALLVLFLGLGLVLADYLISRSLSATVAPIPILFATVPYWVIGALLLWRQPRVRIGWILLAFALFWSLTFLGTDFAALSLEKGIGGVLLAARVGKWTWLLALLIIFLVIPVLFPTGQPISAGWRRVLNLALIYAALFVSATSLQQHLEAGSTRLDNPFALLPMTDAEELLLPFAIPLLLLGALSTVARYRRSRGLVRQQLRWFVFAFMVTIVINGVLDLAQRIGDIPIIISLSAPAVAIGIAVMRYRLFEIDRIISRTVTYGLVTGMLVAVYAATVFLLSTLIPSAESLAVAGATLSAAALFAPARRRAQALVDRRFNRSNYDVRVTMEGLSSRLRSEVDVSALGSEVGRVVSETMQPDKLVVWIR